MFSWKAPSNSYGDGLIFHDEKQSKSEPDELVQPQLSRTNSNNCQHQ